MQLIHYIVTNWPGGTYDAYSWANLALSRLFTKGTIAEMWLLWDRGYSLHVRPWSMTTVTMLLIDPQPKCHIKSVLCAKIVFPFSEY